MSQATVHMIITDYYRMQLDSVMKVTVENHDKVAIS